MENFTNLKELGQGMFATVYLGKDIKTGEWKAIKKLKISGKNKEHALMEFDVMKKFQKKMGGCSPYVLCYEKLIERANYIYLITEYIEGYDLSKIAGKISPIELRKVTKHICTAVALLHENDIVHRDIKPDNVRYNKDGRMMLIDFGFSCETIEMVENTCTLVMRGSPYYFAPEIENIGYDSFHIKDLKGCDMWALGITLYEVAMGKVPYNPELTSVEELFGAMRSGLIDEFIWPDKEMEKLVENLIKYDKEERWTAKMALDFINGMDRLPPPQIPIKPKLRNRTNVPVTKSLDESRDILPVTTRTKPRPKFDSFVDILPVAKPLPKIDSLSKSHSDLEESRDVLPVTTRTKPRPKYSNYTGESDDLDESEDILPVTTRTKPRPRYTPY